MTPREHKKAADKVADDMAVNLASASAQLAALRAALNSGNYSTAYVDTGVISKTLTETDQNLRFLRGHCLEAAIGARAAKNG